MNEIDGQVAEFEDLQNEWFDEKETDDGEDSRSEGSSRLEDYDLDYEIVYLDY